MSRVPQTDDRDVAKPTFDPVAAPWFFPFLVLAALLSFRWFLPGVAEKPELFWLDLALDARARAGWSEPLEPEIRFVQLSVDDEIARRWAVDGEYATAAGFLKTLAALDARVIVVDIIYARGREEDQRVLAEAIREIHETTSTRVLLSTVIERQNGQPYLLRSLSRAGGEEFDEGIVNVPADRHWREYQLVHTCEGETLPSLALAAYGASRPSALAPKVAGEGEMEWKALEGGKAVTRRADGSRVLLNLRHSYYDPQEYDKKNLNLPHRAGRVWTIAELEQYAASKPADSALRDTIVFLGFDAETDGKPTTHGPMEPGMYLHGTALHDLTHGTAIRPAPLWLDLVLHFAVALLAVAAFSRVRSIGWLIASAAAGVAAILGFGWLAILTPGWQVLPAAISAALLWGASVFLEVGRRWSFEARERTRRDAMLGFYFSPAVLKQVMQDLDMIRPRGGEVAVLLSDLRGFTSLCETGRVERVFELLNRLFAIETDAALRENGSLARFAGDQFLAYWGAPEPCDDAADRALRAALEIHTALEARRESPDADELDGWLRIGIGLHHGRALVGHVGSRSYRDYNIVGDSVNTTARIESQTKNYAASILASGEFIAALSEKPPALLVDRVQVKGKSRPTELYAVFAGGGEEEGRRAYEAAFRLYESGDFAAAAAAFEALAEHPHATLATSARLLGERCREYDATPPPQWAGVHELRSK